MSNVQERAIVSRRQACGAFAGLASGLLAGGAEAQPVARTDMLDKKRANARGRFESQSARSKKADPKIQELIGRIDRARLSDMVNTLTSFPTRWTMSPQLVAAGNWIKQQFSDFGYKASRIEQVELRLSNGTTAQNIVCAPERLDHGFVLIGAHYDCISESAATLAPGADDNASGIAAMLEIARIFASVDLKRSVMFAAFAGEEQGLFGSQAVADLAARDRWAIDVMVNLDMVWHVDPARSTNIIVEYDQGNANPRNDAAAKAFGLQMAQLVTDYTGMTVEHTDIWNSDYMPFEAKGYPCIGLYDGAADATFYHTTQDRAGQVDISRLTEVTALLCAFVATTAELKTV